MTPVECVKLVKFLGDRCPAMKFQDGTPDAWYIDLRDIELADALDAVVRASREQAFVSLADLLDECWQVTREREGRQRRRDLEAQIEAENAGALRDRPVSALTVGQPVSSVSALMRQEVARRKQTPAADASPVDSTGGTE